MTLKRRGISDSTLYWRKKMNENHRNPKKGVCPWPLFSYWLAPFSFPNLKPHENFSLFSFTHLHSVPSCPSFWLACEKECKKRAQNSHHFILIILRVVRRYRTKNASFSFLLETLLHFEFLHTYLARSYLTLCQVSAKKLKNWVEYCHGKWNY